jgi:2-keto-3-deoxy-L-rhamnonate aldolase RhmA
VRLPSPGQAVVDRALDAGVDGVVVPRVDSAAQAERAVAALRHPPLGTRGSAARRANAYGLDPLVARTPLCLVQIESAAAIDAIDAIAAVKGVDALVVGCADLALSLGAPAPDASVVRESIERVQAAAAEAGIASGVAGPDDPELLLRLADERSSILVLGADMRVYARSMASAIGALRRAPAPRSAHPEEAHVGA